MGIDPGIAIVGYGFIEYNKKDQYKLIASGSIQTSKNERESLRLLEIYEDIETLIEKFKPNVASIEKLFYFKNQKTVMSVSQARGVILTALEKQKLPIYEYTPIEVKQVLTGYGRASKNEVKQYVEIFLKENNQQKNLSQLDDTVDAIGLAICHCRNII